MKVKYIRWSTLTQTGARQLLDVQNYDLVLQEQISGSVAFAKRPNLDKPEPKRQKRKVEFF